MFVNTKEKAASEQVPITGTKVDWIDVRFLLTAMTAPMNIAAASVDDTIWNVPKSSSNLGSNTMIAAPRMDPDRVLRPPMIVASRNKTVNSKL